MSEIVHPIFYRRFKHEFISISFFVFEYRYQYREMKVKIISKCFVISDLGEFDSEGT